MLRGNPGLTLATTARFHSTASWLVPSGVASLPGPVAAVVAGNYAKICGSAASGGVSDQTLAVRVSSSQLWDEWNYDMQTCHPFALTASYGKRGCVCHVMLHSPPVRIAHVPQPCLLNCFSDGKRNKFVERAIQCSLQVFAHVLPPNQLSNLFCFCANNGLTLHLDLVADNDFYSQRDHVCCRGTERSVRSAVCTNMPSPSAAGARARRQCEVSRQSSEVPSMSPRYIAPSVWSGRHDSR